jgi:hypothetical protein
VPALPQWFLCLPDIIEQLRGLESAVVDRAVIENAFGIGRRRALQLMHRFGGFQSAQSFLVDRQELIQRLEGIVGGERFALEQSRRRSLEEQLESVRKQRAAAAVRIPIVRENIAGKGFAAPMGMRLGPGRMEVAFSGAEDLLAKLFSLSQAVAEDFAGFRRCIENDSV